MNDGQMTIDEWLKDVETLRPACKIEHPVIKKLSGEIHELLSTGERDGEDYSVWEHTPQLGLRYQVWYRRVQKLDECKMAELVKRYKRYDLEVSFNELNRADGSRDIMVSSMWTNHKEPKINCTHNKECITFCIGCNGINYWCKRYD